MTTPHKIRNTGHYLSSTLCGGEFKAFIPHPLPPEPPLEWSAELEAARDKANRAIGRLDGISGILPDPALFLYQYVRKEALLSSQIEGTQSSLSDLLLYELEQAPGVPIDDVQEVSNYVHALNYGLKKLRDGFPLSLRLIKEIHAILLNGARGKNKSPGEFRRSQVWLGGANPSQAEFVPPTAEKVPECLDAFEKFLHDQPQATPVLVKAALAHVQFETIHPFLDGNGRLGRLLITLLLCAQDVLREPMLYLSLYFKQNRSEYYNQLQQVRLTGDWESWLHFFFDGIYQTAGSAVSAAQRTLELFQQDTLRLQNLGKSAGTAIRIHQLLQRHPVITVQRATEQLQMGTSAINRSLNQLESIGLLRELTGQQRYRVWAYNDYLNILSEGAEPL